MLDQAIADLRYGTIAVNAWTGVGYLTARATWGAFPGHSTTDIQSGRGVVHNALLFERPQKSVVRGPFRPAPRSLAHGELALSPRAAVVRDQQDGGGHRTAPDRVRRRRQPQALPRHLRLGATRLTRRSRRAAAPAPSRGPRPARARRRPRRPRTGTLARRAGELARDRVEDARVAAPRAADQHDRRIGQRHRRRQHRRRPPGERVDGRSGVQQRRHVDRGRAGAAQAERGEDVGEAHRRAVRADRRPGARSRPPARCGRGAPRRR